jgi:uracil-DNA glycosylase family 4
MASVSTDDSKPDEDVLDALYYHHLWKNRLGWTRHIIPVRAYDAKTGFFVEAYATIVSAISDLKKQKIELKLAFLPTMIYDTVFVNITHVYPTSRNLTLIKDDEIIVSPKSDKFLPTKKIGVHKLKKLFNTYKDCKFTLKELESMLNNKIPPGSDLVKDGTKHCSIDAKEAVAFSGTEAAQVVLDSVDLSDVHTTFQALLADFQGCTKCELGTKRVKRGESLQVTTGRLGDKTWGEIPVDAEADIMLIGESPGLQDEERGRMFYGGAPAGDVLKKVITAAGFDENKCFYTSAVLCRPESLENKSQNGKPTVEHIKACNKRLKNEIALAQPKVIVLLGKVGYKAFYGEDPTSVLSSSGWKDEKKTIYFAPHPSFVARELSFAEVDKTAGIKRDYLKHFKSIKKRLDELKN